MDVINHLLIEKFYEELGQYCNFDMYVHEQKIVHSHTYSKFWEEKVENTTPYYSKVVY
jgi:hypothetical protein